MLGIILLRSAFIHATSPNYSIQGEPHQLTWFMVRGAWCGEARLLRKSVRGCWINVAPLRAVSMFSGRSVVGFAQRCRWTSVVVKDW